jgi:formylglycine-generating enzyme required for sulfatase activity
MWFYRFLFASLVITALAGSLATIGAPLPPRRELRENPLGMKFVRLPRGTFSMGGGISGEAVKQTAIEMDFEIAIHTVTQGQWQALMNNNPSCFSRDGKGNDAVKNISDADLKQFPVENVSWYDANDFIIKLNEKERGNGYWYRLPTEAEWEYACRGGAASEEEGVYHFYFAKPTNDLSSEQANFNGNYPFGNAPKGKFLDRPTKVGSYPPNKLGLYDMHGNVWQWSADLEEGGSRHILRGGSWETDGSNCQAANRYRYAPELRHCTFGFRVARVPSGGK